MTGIPFRKVSVVTPQEEANTKHLALASRLHGCVHRSRWSRMGALLMAAQVYAAAVEERLGPVEARFKMTNGYKDMVSTTEVVASELTDMKIAFREDAGISINFAYLIAAVETYFPEWGIPLPGPVAAQMEIEREKTQ